MKSSSMNLDLQSPLSKTELLLINWWEYKREVQD
jgi:hypothetical protein